ncbi:thymidylate kinase-domain-containing protein [Hysterangium stoloniferum]|nr:thymidylate kinase-domain-containing protein [Hysterangium stoloniferum]
MTLPFFVEGLDRSGKTTQTSLLHDYLASNGRVQLVKFPDRTTAIGKMIDNYLRSQSDLDDHAIHLLFSANRWEVAPTIERLLQEGTTVICDRYAFSGVAFTFAKALLAASSGEAGRLTYEWCRAPDIGLPAPDLTIFLDITPDAAKLRGGYGDERYEKEEMQRHVRDVFQRIKDDVCQTGGRWVVIDAGREKEVVQHEIREHVGELVGSIDSKVGSLWSSL